MKIKGLYMKNSSIKLMQLGCKIKIKKNSSNNKFSAILLLSNEIHYDTIFEREIET